MSSVNNIKLIKQVKCFGGYVKQYSHQSAVNNCTMQFCVYLPPQAQNVLTADQDSDATDAGTASSSPAVPVLYYLAGLTCNEELVMIKSGAIRTAATRGIAIVSPDTSPRNVSTEIIGQDDSYDFGYGAGFYLDANTPGWREHYNMESYVTSELPGVIKANFPEIDTSVQSITGHSMGGHGALTLALKHPELYHSVSAFAPICHPLECPWGVKAFTGYLGGPSGASWEKYDACCVLRDAGKPSKFETILIDQGTDDQFYREKQLLPEAFEAACKEVGQAVTMSYREGYDHSYYFISTFMEEHVNFHADAMQSS